MKLALTHVDLPNESKGGVAHQVHYLANALVQHGHDVTLFTFSPAYSGCLYNVRTLSRPRAPRWSTSVLFGLRLGRTDFSEFEVLHTNGDNFLTDCSVPQVRTFYGSATDEANSAVSLKRRIYQRFSVFLEALGARKADVNVGISEATRRRLPAVSRIIPCGVDLMRFRPGPKAERPAVLFVGTVGGRKRGAMLAEIFEREVRPQIPGVQLWSVANGPLAGEGVVNHGYVPLERLTELYQRAWVFCLPSSYEGFGVPYIEAMASGTAVVASANPGACEVLSTGQYGVIAADEEIGGQINHLLGDNFARAEFAARGLIRAQEFSWDRVAEQYEQIYAELAITK